MVDGVEDPLSDADPEHRNAPGRSPEGNQKGRTVDRGPDRDVTDQMNVLGAEPSYFGDESCRLDDHHGRRQEGRPAEEGEAGTNKQLPTRGLLGRRSRGGFHGTGG